MNRREALFATGALLAAAGTAQAADHSHHHHDGAHPWQAVLDTAGICIEKGEVCLTHCIMLLGEGDKAMAACATSVREMLASCRALISLAAAESKFAPGWPPCAWTSARPARPSARSTPTSTSPARSAWRAAPNAPRPARPWRPEPARRSRCEPARRRAASPSSPAQRPVRT
jgi:hypothetical protein